MRASQGDVGARERRAARDDRALRSVAIGCLIGIAVTHLIDVGHKFEEAPAIATLFVALIVGCNVLALLFLARRRPTWLWTAAAACAIGPFLGYIASRTIGLPQIEDHVGHWADPVGTASLVFEAVLLAVALRATRVPALRFAPAAVFVAAGMTMGGWMLGQAGDSHAGHGGGGHGGSDHGGSATAGAGHHGGGDGTAGQGHAAAAEHRHAGANIDTATPRQQKEARTLIKDTTAAVAPYASFDAAKAAGYGFTMKSFEDQKDLDYWHLTHPGYLEDGRDLAADAPESLMYWNPRDGKEPVLVAVVFRVPTASPNPELGGPIVPWHLHKSRNCGVGKYKMTHMWLLPRLRDAFSMELPAKEMNRRYGTPADGSGSGL